MTNLPTDNNEFDDVDIDLTVDNDIEIDDAINNNAEDFKSGAHTRTFVAVPSQQENQDYNIIRKKKRHREKKKVKKPVLIGAIFVSALVLLGVGVVVAYNIGQKNMHTVANVAIASPDAAVSHSEGKRIQYQGHTYQLNEDMVSILIIGYDSQNKSSETEAESQADAVAVLAMDSMTGKMTVIGVPRDSMVDVDKYTADGAYTGTEKTQLCLAYYYGYGATASCENVSKAVSRALYNIPLDYYFALDEAGVGALTDAVGGVPLTALETIPQSTIVAGEDTILFEDEALRYVQYRDTSKLNSSLMRQERQMQFVRAFASQTMVTANGNVTMLLGLYNTAAEYSLTNLGITEFTFLATSLVRNGITGVDVSVLGGEMVMGDKYAEFNLDSNSVYQTVLDVYYKQVN